MTKEKMTKQFHKIQKMDGVELEKFSREVSLAELNKESQTMLFRAIEIRQGELEDTISPMVAEGEISRGGSEF